MKIQHKELARGKWKQMPFLEQMANIGSEVERALNWRAKNNPPYSRQAFERALELLEITLDDMKNAKRFKEIARVREAIVDYFDGSNLFSSSDALWRKYFYFFNYAARRGKTIS
ncbi:MAG: hypothetical protein ABII64_01815 [Elusimicrobiota bacterium]